MILMFFAIMLVIKTFGQTPILLGYWNNWDAGVNPYIQLDQVPKQFNFIAVAFATSEASGPDYRFTFSPLVVSQNVFKSQIKTLQSQGRKVIISIGGLTCSDLSLDSLSEIDSFVSSITKILDTYDFDGVDVDLEGNSVLSTGGTIENPKSTKIVNLISAIKRIMVNYRLTHGKKMVLTMSPQMTNFPGGVSGYYNDWGAYLPIIDALRDDVDLVSTQLYNGGPNGSMVGADGNPYKQSTGDFIVAMTELCIRGFNTGGGHFNGLPASKIAVCLPACPNAAFSGGFTDTSVVAAAMRYLMGKGPKVGSYTLLQKGGYPTLGGMTTWSINWDRVVTCNSSEYEFMKNYERIFNNTPTTIAELTKLPLNIYPNPTVNYLSFSEKLSGEYEIKNMFGQIVERGRIEGGSIDVTNLKRGYYIIGINNRFAKFSKQ